MKETMSNTKKKMADIISTLKMLDNSGHGKFTIKELKEYFISLREK